MSSILNNKLFDKVKIGPIELPNRVIRASAYEGMADGHTPTDQLIDYHTSVARGGVGMTGVAYAAVNQSGLSFHRQLWIRDEITTELMMLTSSIHSAGAKACIQLGHCGNMSHRRYCGCRPVGPTSGFNLYSPTFVHGLKREEIVQIAEDFGKAVKLARFCRFDAVEIHAGHGYLISQFLSPYTNHRKDEFGGSLENRMRFMEMVMKEVMEAAGDDLAVLVKINTRDGFKGGMETDECIQVAKRLQECGAHALVLSGGFVSRAPMYVMKGKMPVRTLWGYMPWKSLWWLKIGIALFGKIMIPDEPYKELFFLEDSLKFREALPDMPLAYVGGVNSVESINQVLDAGFDFVEMARPLVHDPMFINKLKKGTTTKSGCKHANYCVARIWNYDMKCHEKCRLSPYIEREIQRNIHKG